MLSYVSSQPPSLLHIPFLSHAQACPGRDGADEHYGHPFPPLLSPTPSPPPPLPDPAQPCSPNPCGVGKCSAAPGSTVNTCSCPTGFAAVTNVDGTQSCSPGERWPGPGPARGPSAKHLCSLLPDSNKAVRSQGALWCCVRRCCRKEHP